MALIASAGISSAMQKAAILYSIPHRPLTNAPVNAAGGASLLSQRVRLVVNVMYARRKHYEEQVEYLQNAQFQAPLLLLHLAAIWRLPQLWDVN